MKRSIIYSGLFTTIIAQFAFGYVLNDEEQRRHEDCSNNNNERSAPVESVDRATCEKFALPVGRIERYSLVIPYDDRVAVVGEPISSGTGTLIAPDIILTAAHVVDNCINQPGNCIFSLDNESIAFSDIKIPKEYLSPSEIVTLKKQSEEFNKKPDLKYDKLSSEQRDAIDKLTAERSKLTSLGRNFDLQQFQKIQGDIDKLMKGLDLSAVGYYDNLIRIEESKKHDIALVKLKKGFSNKTLGQILFDDSRVKKLADSIENYGEQRMYGVSAQNLTSNTNAKMLNKETRHIAEIHIDKLDKNMGILVARYKLPANYSPTCHMDPYGEAVDTPTRFQYNSEKDPFLKGAPQPGDSGGPLVYIDDTTKQSYIAGVMSLTASMRCNLLKGNIAGKEYSNNWTFVPDHKSWILNTMQEYGEAEPLKTTITEPKPEPEPISISPKESSAKDCPKITLTDLNNLASKGFSIVGYNFLTPVDENAAKNIKTAEEGMKDTTFSPMQAKPSDNKDFGLVCKYEVNSNEIKEVWLTKDNWDRMTAYFEEAFKNGDVNTLNMLKSAPFGNLNDLGGPFLIYGSGKENWDKMIEDAKKNK